MAQFADVVMIFDYFFYAFRYFKSGTSLSKYPNGVNAHKGSH